MAGLGGGTGAPSFVADAGVSAGGGAVGVGMAVAVGGAGVSEGATVDVAGAVVTVAATVVAVDVGGTALTCDGAAVGSALPQPTTSARMTTSKALARYRVPRAHLSHESITTLHKLP